MRLVIASSLSTSMMSNDMIPKESESRNQQRRRLGEGELQKLFLRKLLSMNVLANSLLAVLPYCRSSTPVASSFSHHPSGIDTARRARDMRTPTNDDEEPVSFG